MFARITINTRSYPNVITVPAEAVVSNRTAGGGFTDTVFVIGANNAGQPIAVRREVSTGVTLKGWTEIRTGLEKGEAVIVQGQQLLGGGETLRIIGSPVAQGGVK
jgi:multidrug efflux pump subunit AcrA (membrane-fusion protein)